MCNFYIFLVTLISVQIFSGSSVAIAAAVPGVTDNEVVIGAHTSESGKGALAAPYAQAIRAYFKDINEKGGVHGRQIKWLGVDTQSLQAKSVEATRTLVEKDNIFAMVGGQGASHVAVYKYLLDKGVPDIFIQDFHLEYIEPYRKSVFTAWYVAKEDGYAQGKYVAKRFKGKKACWVLQDNASSEQNKDGSLQALTEENTNLKDAEKIIIGTTVVTDRMATQANSEVLRLRKDKCDVVFIGTNGAITLSTINFAANQGFYPMWVTYWANVTAPAVELINKSVFEKGFVATHPIAVEDGMGAINFAAYENFRKKYNLPVSGNTSKGFYVAELFTEALKRAGKDLTREKIIEAAESLGGFKCSLCIAPIELSPTQHMPIKTPIFLGVKDGKWILHKN